VDTESVLMVAEVVAVVGLNHFDPIVDTESRKKTAVPIFPIGVSITSIR